MNEQWKEIKGTEGHYEVSNKGNLRSYFNGKYRPIKQYVNSSGYMTATFPINGIKKRRQVHRLVAFAFMGKDECRTLINHKDCNKTNNDVNNLEWCTNQENILYAVRQGVKYGKPHHEKQVIRSDGTIFSSMSEAARAINVPYSYIRDVCRGKQHSTRGYSFSYVNGGDE